MEQRIRAHSHLLERTRRPAIMRNQLQVTYSRGPNLGDLLNNSMLNKQKIVYGCKPCNKPCAKCRHVSTFRTVTSEQTKKKYNTTGEYTCQTTSVIYVLTCNTCKIQYVGESGNTVNERFRSHIYDIRHQRDKPVSNHMNTPKQHRLHYSHSRQGKGRPKHKETPGGSLDHLNGQHETGGLNARW